MSKSAITAAPILPVLAERWSPRAYDATHEISQHELLSVLEAARWAPSGNNTQPWRFSVATRGTDLFEKIRAGLGGFNAAWSPNASAYVAVSVTTHHADGSPVKSAKFDAGLATSQLVIQAHELGLHAHIMGGIEHQVLTEALELPAGVEILVVVTLGKVAPATTLEGPAYEREIAPRTRLELDEIVLTGKP
ncbi:nitroreductase family protein [Rhodoluna sp. KAS3]|uniref:nitroreductase family protein n=1 Tax=Rhodoluna sp. KAS3 TaxID=942880 RepID=UPI00223228F3|nr:nitroreductase family protein [Rhodoluna sp. KAS3]BDS48548.1 oxidoreductase [Rhodoluna sp. KAS3]